MEKFDSENPGSVPHIIGQPMYPENGVNFVPGPNQPQGTVMSTVITHALQPTFGPHPCPIKCPHCYVSAISETTHVSGLATYLLCGGCCFLGLWLCCCIPFCMDSAKDVHHYCPSCKTFLGRYKRVGS